MAAKRLHRVNPALIAHAVPLAYCERAPILIVVGISIIPAAVTGMVHWQPDLFGVAVFFPGWAACRALYLYDPRCMSKIIGHLTWEFERYVPRAPRDRRLAQSASRASVTRRLSSFFARLMRS